MDAKPSEAIDPTCDGACGPAGRRRVGFWITILIAMLGLAVALAAIGFSRGFNSRDGNREGHRLQAIKVNLRTIDNVKTQWAAENKNDTNAVPSEADLAPYFNGGKFPQPVVWETYRINALDVAPVAVTPSKLLDIPPGGTITMDDAAPAR